MSIVQTEEVEEMDTADPAELAEDLKGKMQQPNKDEEKLVDVSTSSLEFDEDLVLDEDVEYPPRPKRITVDPTLLFRCRNNFWGCQFWGPYSKLLEHEPLCEADVDDCPLDVILKCGWRGHEHDFRDHCCLAHPNLKFAPNGKCSVWQNFVNITSENDKLVMLILAYGELFYCLAEVDMEERLMKWAVYYVGEPAGAAPYSYEIDFEAEPLRKGCYCIRRKCETVTDGDVSFRENGCGIMYYKMLKNLCVRTELIYYVRIQKNIL